MIEFNGQKYSCIEMFNINTLSLSGGETKETDAFKKTFALSAFSERKNNNSKANVSVVVTGHSTTFFITDNYGIRDVIWFSNKHQDSIDDAIYLAVKDKLLTSLIYLDEDEKFMPSKPSPVSFNTWFLSQPEGRRKVLIDDKWMISEAAFKAGVSIGQQNILLNRKDKTIISEIPFLIKDGNNGDNQLDINGKITVNPYGIGISIDGFTSPDNYDQIIYLEKYNDVVNLRVHADNTRTEPTNSIDLSCAKVQN